MKILILGSKGMLGQMVSNYFSRSNDYVVIEYDEKYTLNTHDEYIERVNSLCADVVVNCIGLIKQRDTNSQQLYQVNAIFPGLLARDLRENSILVHPSTDCVFAGDSLTPYSDNHIYDAKDDYGLSKAMGEIAVGLRPRTLIIRSSIIGPDCRSNGLGLMSWFMSNKPGSVINGYTNHFWNGITTLEWCKVASLHLSDALKLSRAKLIQPGTVDPVTKYDLLSMINIKYESKIEINRHEDNDYVYRVLRPNHICCPIEKQLSDLINI